ncbi:multiheme c-type cytochrome [Litorilituus lipolyticus]|uniref:Tetratricopeptide repeat protein n=1 Tax=Litorilituus lipolyticus TaxID=2491017 RepID=A0A502L1L9_9GAMM|nr:multiheme c-type cytochrome [Litorilituus lipolyticus]TPH15903.1 tetratricopeptide repeat protein [Litorilituus lipolyticus]
MIIKQITFIAFFIVFFIFTISATEYVGVKQCESCHQKEYQAWQGSHHDMSMKHANSASVLGNFTDFKFVENNQANRFYRKENQYWVNIKGPDGKFHDYQIKYTFGYEPLQQYMVEFDDGRVQLIPFAWDSRPKSQGGQRWFNLYPQFTQNHQEFFWTNTGQNWNYMCADCHSTNVSKNFDVESNSYKTAFSEINVACEACHGPASEHIKWTKQINTDDNIDKGFSRDLSRSVKAWALKDNATTMSPTSIKHSQQNLVCAQCHSRHVQISDKDHIAANEFGERYMLSLINSSLYYPDGQVYDENFVYGSFLQSKMNANGVVCSNCHDPHSAQLTLPQEVICLQCHQADNYANKKHHNHKESSAGAQCVNCHMPETTYMQVDNRRDHGWHIPRPDFAQQFNTPDSCLTCHQDKDSQWSDKHVLSWFPDSTIRRDEHFAPVFAAADLNYPGISKELSKIAQTKPYPAIIRASALDRLANKVDTNSLIAIARAVKSEESIIRLGAINGAIQLPAVERWRVLSPLLTDEVLAVRAEAASALTPLWQELNPDQQHLLQSALNDYLSIQHFNNDRGFAHTNTANILVHQGKYTEAQQAYQQSIKIEPYFARAYINLAELYRLQKNNKQTLITLLNGFEKIPDSAELAYALGLAYIRNKQATKANLFFAKATEFAPENSNYFYVYGISLEQTQPLDAYKALLQAYRLSNNPQHLYTLCDMQLRNNSSQAKQCLSKLSKVAPDNVIKQLKAQYKIN